MNRKAGRSGPSPEDLERLRELEQNTPETIRKQRSSHRIEIRARVVVQPGNTSDARTMKAQGVTGDVSSGGCQVLLPVPLNVGDTYRLSFDRGELDLPMLFARCVRCRLIREDAFESGFSFFSSIDLTPDLVPASEAA